MLLAVLLPLPAGLAQATMVMPMAAEVVGATLHADEGDHAQMADGMPCHEEAVPATPDHSPHHDGCCDLGNCHCVAACGLTLSAVRVTVQRLMFEPPALLLSVWATAHPPDLRPPIG